MVKSELRCREWLARQRDPTQQETVRPRAPSLRSLPSVSIFSTAGVPRSPIAPSAPSCCCVRSASSPLSLLILVELISGSKLSIQKFGISFFFGSAWDPVNGNFGALPFIYGTVVSSILSLIIAVPLAVGVAIFLTEMCPALSAWVPGLLYRIAGRHSQRGLWSVGGFCSDSAAAPVRKSVPHQDLGWSGFLPAPTTGLGCSPRA